MKQLFILFLFVCGIYPLTSVEPPTAPTILVSAAPYEILCRDITQGAVHVQQLVPAGFSPHTYEPTPKEVLSCRQAKVWFIIGELFEDKVRSVLTKSDPNLVVADLRDGLTLLGDTCQGHHAHDEKQHHNHVHTGSDPHIWMSPKMMIIQAKTIAKTLKLALPSLTAIIDENLPKTVAKLELLDRDIEMILAKSKNTTLFVSHPAYGYFCRDYHLKQKAIEFEGKDPTARQIFDLIQEGKRLHIKTIFTQPQYSNKAASAIAGQIGATLVALNPYDANYYENMRHIAQAFSKTTQIQTEQIQGAEDK